MSQFTEDLKTVSAAITMMYSESGNVQKAWARIKEEIAINQVKLQGLEDVDDVAGCYRDLAKAMFQKIVDQETITQVDVEEWEIELEELGK